LGGKQTSEVDNIGDKIDGGVKERIQRRSSAMKRTQVIIVRHGQTEWNIKGIRQGHLDSPLTNKGMVQAKALALRLARESFTALYSSDLGRAVQTATEISKLTGHDLITDPQLRERHLGIFQGLNGDEIKEKYPEERRLLRTMGPDYVIPGGESMRQQVARNVAYLEHLAHKHDGETIVVVTHGGVVSGFFRHTLSIPFDAPRRFEFVNAGLNVFAHEAGNWLLLTWGDVSHLAPGAASEGDDP
jgi:probable phosphoglycerate mutase